MSIYPHPCPSGPSTPSPVRSKRLQLGFPGGGAFHSRSAAGGMCRNKGSLGSPPRRAAGQKLWCAAMSDSHSSTVTVDLTGRALIERPLLNKGTAFTAQERREFNLLAHGPS